MIPELGHAALCFALAIAVLQAALPALSRLLAPHSVRGLSKPLALLFFLLISSSFAALMFAHATSDFTVLNVIENSHTLKPMLFKITGTWGNHEGSMMLWVWVLALFGFFVALRQDTSHALSALTLSVHGAISTGFLLFILLTSNPFVRVFPPPENGEDLNPLLQDIGLALHPPMLYVGYVGFGIVFAYAVAGMLQNRIDKAWAKAVQPWMLFTWGTLTAGIGLGSWWAYRELGWGGWWFWDPVENVSLLPWFTGGALVHATTVLEKRGSYARWVALLAILTFGMSLVGTFIVRSGLITSVHSFASDPARGLFILAYITLVTGSALLLFARFKPEAAEPEMLASRAGLILINNLLMVCASLSILLAILYPVFLTLMKLPTISVGPPYFNAVIVPLCTPLLALAAMAPLLPWHGADKKLLQQLLWRMAPVVGAALLLAYALIDAASLMTLVSLALAAMLLFGAALYLRKAWRAIPAEGGAKWKRISLRALASAMGHAGLAIFVCGVVATHLFKVTYEAPASVGDTLQFGSYSAHVVQIENSAKANYFRRRATIELMQNGQPVATLQPEMRFYPVRGQETSESALKSSWWRDFYAVAGRANYAARGETEKDNAPLGLRIYIVPGQSWIWLGFLLAAASAFASCVSTLRARFTDKEDC